MACAPPLAVMLSIRMIEFDMTTRPPQLLHLKMAPPPRPSLIGSLLGSRFMSPSYGCRCIHTSVLRTSTTRLGSLGRPLQLYPPPAAPGLFERNTNVPSTSVFSTTPGCS